MSYILDALRKSEQERQRGKVPDFTTTPEAPLQKTTKMNLWPVIAAVAVIVNLALALYFWNQKQESPRSIIKQESQSALAPVQMEPGTLPSPKTGPKKLLPVIEKPVSVSNPPPQPKPRITPQPEVITPKPSPAIPSIGYLPQMEELAPGQRQSIPDMTFSSHMYSSMPKYRSIIINGKRLKEGQFYNSDLQVREITESGVIMSQDSTLFEVDVLGRWAQ